MVSVTEHKYTVVQHSAYGYKGDGMFARGLETRQIANRSQARKIEQAGGVVLSYEQAEDFADAAMYGAAGAFGLVPDAQGAFADMEVDGLRLYLPAPHDAVPGCACGEADAGAVGHEQVAG